MIRLLPILVLLVASSLIARPNVVAEKQDLVAIPMGESPGPDSIEIAELTSLPSGQGFQVDLLHTDEYRMVVKSGRLAIEGKKERGQAGLFWDHWGIRAVQPVPGDDLAFSFVVGNDVTSLGPRLAVYDKKLLWRANLYIEEKDKTDWNDLHPWIGEVLADGSTPDSAGANHNEWNRIYDGTQNVSRLDQLEFGAGGQVVKFPEWTPVRTLKGTKASPAADNKLTGTVAYSYPVHPNEPTSSNPGFAGSMDSPFDFVWKMTKEKLAMSNHYNANGTTGGSVVSVGQWGYTRAPTLLSSQWKFYLPAVGNNEGFLPGLGLYKGKPNSITEDGIDDTGWNYEKTFEAGTDCVGFAQVAAGYAGNPYTQWGELREGVLESGATSYRAVLSRYEANGQRRIPRTVGEGDSIIHNKSGVEPSAYINTKESSIATMNAEQKATLLKRLRQVVPGDIWMKESSASDSGWDAHIAVVASVPSDSDIVDPIVFMNNMILVEGEFNSKIQSIIKKLSVGDYNRSEIAVGTNIYTGFTVADQSSQAGNQGIDLNCESWTIRRLK